MKNYIWACAITFICCYGCRQCEQTNQERARSAAKAYEMGLVEKVDQRYGRTILTKP